MKVVAPKKDIVFGVDIASRKGDVSVIYYRGIVSGVNYSPILIQNTHYSERHKIVHKIQKEMNLIRFNAINGLRLPHETPTY